MMNPVAMSIITQVFHRSGERARAIGVLSCVVWHLDSLFPIVVGALIQLGRLALGVLDQPADLRLGDPC